MIKTNIINYLDSRMAADGYRRLAEGIWSWPVKTGISGWVGLNIARGPEATTCSVNPVVGIRHDAIEAIVGELAGDPAVSRRTPTISSNIGYFDSLPAYKEYTFWGDVTDQSVADSLLGDLRAFGMPAVTPLADLSVLRQAMKSKQMGIQAMSQLRYPIILCMLGEHASVKAMAAEVLGALEGKQGASEVFTREYFRRLVNWCEEHERAKKQ